MFLTPPLHDEKLGSSTRAEVIVTANPDQAPAEGFQGSHELYRVRQGFIGFIGFYRFYYRVL